VQIWLAFEWGIDTEVWNIYKLLERRGWSRKVAERRYYEQNDVLRAHWLARRLGLRADRLIFLDESGSNRRSGYRKFGWSPIGIPVYNLISANRGEKWSILPALTINGYLPGALVCTGSVNQELFNSWVETRVLPHCVPGESIIIMDNCAIHKDKDLLRLLNDRGVLVEFLPPYCLEFNPIEFSFNQMKAFIRRYGEMAVEFETFGHFLHYVLEHCASPEASRGFFNKAGYDVE
jgi:hypothetical protein